MKTLARQDYTRYTETALKLESLIYVQNRVIGNLEQMYKSREPQLAQESMPDMPPLHTQKGPDYKVKSRIGIIISLVIGLLAFWAFMGGSYVLALVGLFFFLWLLLFSTVSYFFGKNENAASIEANRLAAEEYERKCKAVQERNEAAAELYRKQHADWEDLGKQCRDTEDFMRVQLKQTETMLEKLYSLDVIYPKYRTIAALSSFNEYFTTGRCEELGGTHGAYNLYEDEVRRNGIVSGPDISASDLEKIRSTQYVFYQQVTRIRQAIAELTRSLDASEDGGYDIRTNTAFSAFYDEAAEEYRNCLKMTDEFEMKHKEPEVRKKVILKKPVTVQ